MAVMFTDRFWVVFNTFSELQSFKVMLAYLLMVVLSGVYQKNTQPLSLRRVLVPYNYLCSFISVVTMVLMIVGIVQSGSIYLKESVPIIETAFLLYWITKNIELLDTVFMILRHKRRQISFLHVYHHSSMVILSDFGYHYVTWPAIAFGLAMNSFVHVCLYYYYGCTAQHPESPPPWKKKITQLQIAQFLIGLVHNSIGYMYYGFCIYSTFYGMSMLYMFSSFYYGAFLKKKKDM